MVERMLSDPESQKMMYPYLPEHMRNPETFKWMMENPEMKAQITTMLENQFSEMDPNLVSLAEERRSRTSTLENRRGWFLCRRCGPCNTV